MPDSSYLKLLNEKRNQALSLGRSIIDDATAERRADLTAEEEAAWARSADEVREIDAQIAAIRERDRREGEADQARATVSHLLRPTLEGDHGESRALDAMDRFMRGQGAPWMAFDFSQFTYSAPGGGIVVARNEARDIYGYAGAGTLGALAPTLTAQYLYEVLLDTGAIWRLNPDRVATPNGNPRTWPKMTAAGTATLTAEGVAITEADPTMGTIGTTPYGFKNLTQLSNEVVQDSAVDVTTFVARHMGYAMDQKYGTLFATGTGTGQPQGYMTGGSVTVQAAGTCSPDSFIKLQHSVNQRYRKQGMFATNDGVASYVRRLRADAGGTTGPWLVSMPSAAGLPEQLFGAPLVIDNYITAHGSAVKSVAYGDFKNGYLIHDGGYRYDVSTDYAFGNDLVSYRGVWRLDGKVRDANAIAVYQATAN